MLLSRHETISACGRRTGLAPGHRLHRSRRLCGGRGSLHRGGMGPCRRGPAARGADRRRRARMVVRISRRKAAADNVHQRALHPRGDQHAAAGRADRRRDRRRAPDDLAWHPGRARGRDRAGRHAAAGRHAIHVHSGRDRPARTVRRRHPDTRCRHGGHDRDGHCADGILRRAAVRGLQMDRSRTDEACEESRLVRAGGVANIHDHLELLHADWPRLAIASAVHLSVWFVGTLEIYIALHFMGYPVSFARRW